MASFSTSCGDATTQTAPTAQGFTLESGHRCAMSVHPPPARYRPPPVPPHEYRPMPIWLDAADCAASPMAGRLVFVVDLDGGGSDDVVEALKAVPGAVIPGGGEDFLDDALGPIIGNYLSGQEVGGGMFALVEPQPFLLGVR